MLLKRMCKNYKKMYDIIPKCGDRRHRQITGCDKFAAVYLFLTSSISYDLLETQRDLPCHIASHVR